MQWHTYVCISHIYLLNYRLQNWHKNETNVINTQSIIVRNVVGNCDLKNETEMIHLIINVEILLLLAS